MLTVMYSHSLPSRMPLTPCHRPSRPIIPYQQHEQLPPCSFASASLASITYPKNLPNHPLFIRPKCNFACPSLLWCAAVPFSVAFLA